MLLEEKNSEDSILGKRSETDEDDGKQSGNQDNPDRKLEIRILKGGKVLLPRGHPICLEIAIALGDPAAIVFCEQAEMSEIIFGDRHCG